MVLMAAAGAGLLAQYPRLRDLRDGSDLEPGLLQVDRLARGDVALGDGVYVVLGPGGLTISRRTAIVWRSVDRGAPVTAGLGRLEWRGADASGAGVLRAREVVDQVLGNVRVTDRSHRSNVVAYTGRIFDGGDVDGDRSRPLTLTITRRSNDSRVLLDVSVPGADVVAIHEYRRPGFDYRGLGEQFAPVGSGRWPVVTRAQGVGRGAQPLTLHQDWAFANARGGDSATTPAPMPFYLSSTLSGVGLDSNAYAVIDLSHGGRVDLSVWSSSLRARLYDASTPRALVAQHAADVGRMRAAPDWATSAAIIGVGGGSSRLRQAVKALRDNGAAVGGVLVRDGGDRRLYPDWNALVAELGAAGVRTMTTVSPSLSPTRRVGGPDDEPALHAYAQSRGWLVAGALVDLTNPAAFAWYTTILADRLRSDGLAGWLALGGGDLPMDARLANGTPSTEHNAWPRRWAELTAGACRAAALPECLVLQDTADERTPRSVGAFNQSEQVSDWSAQDGLASVLPAKLSAGLSGMTSVHSGVGGLSSPAVPLLGFTSRSDELLARWAELEAFGSLLRSEDGAEPVAMPQVWDSPARLAAFTRATRLFAATAAYRRRAMAEASANGLPVVRPAWLADVGQAGADGQYFFGAALLVVPVLAPGQREVRAVLPAGRWVDLFTGRTYDGAVVPAPTPTRRGEGPVPEPPDVPPPPAQGVDVAPPVVVSVPAPLGQPVVLYRVGDKQGAALRKVLQDRGLLR